VFGVVAIFAQRSTAAMQFLDVYPLQQRLVFASYGFVMYLVKLVVPFSLSAVFPYPVHSGVALTGWLYAYPVVLLAAACIEFGIGGRFDCILLGHDVCTVRGVEGQLGALD